MKITEALEKGNGKAIPKRGKSYPNESDYVEVDAIGVLVWYKSTGKRYASAAATLEDIISDDWFPYEEEKCEACKHKVILQDSMGEEIISNTLLFLLKDHCTCKETPYA